MSFDPQYITGIEIPDVLQSGAVIAVVAEEKLRLSLRVKSSDRAAIGKELGLTLPVKIGATSNKAEAMVACLGPDEWIVIADKDKHSKLYGKALKLSGKYIMSVTDISHRNVALILSGPAAAETVNVGCPLDLSLMAFPIGKCTRTVFESAPIMLYRTSENTFVMECWRSFAPYMLGLVEAHAKAIKSR